MTEATFKQLWLRDNYPTTIICDRYSGTYSGADWLAFPLDYSDVPEEVDGGDTECWMFWDNYDGIVGKGNTPQEAMNDLIKMMSDDTSCFIPRQ